MPNASGATFRKVGGPESPSVGMDSHGSGNRPMDSPPQTPGSPHSNNNQDHVSTTTLTCWSPRGLKRKIKFVYLGYAIWEVVMFGLRVAGGRTKYGRPEKKGDQFATVLDHCEILVDHSAIQHDSRHSRVPTLTSCRLNASLDIPVLLP